MTTLTTESWIYIVGDGKTPGDYKFVDGYALSNESASKILFEENPRSAALDLSESCEGCEVAIVEVSLDSDGEPVKYEVISTHRSEEEEGR
jgi:hypothetical protein